MTTATDLAAIRAEYPDATDDEVVELLDQLNASRIAKARAEAEAAAEPEQYHHEGFAPQYEVIRTQYVEPESVDGHLPTLAERWAAFSEVAD